jgi:hypothetical protein
MRPAALLQCTQNKISRLARREILSYSNYQGKDCSALLLCMLGLVGKGVEAHLLHHGHKAVAAGG